jgi:nicotinate phosphoribosyltransferase
MAYGYWRGGRHNDHAVFDLFFRKNPFKGEFCVFAGIEDVLKFVENYR